MPSPGVRPRTGLTWVRAGGPDNNRGDLLGLDLTAVNADGTTGLPMPTVAILDAGHILRWIDVHADYSTRTEPAQVLRALDHLGT